MKRLRYDNKTIRTVAVLEQYRQTPLKKDRTQVRKLAAALGLETTEALLRFREEKELLLLLDEVRGQGLCCSLGQLAVTGRDLIRLGYPEGKKIGETLNRLLRLVLDEKIDNQRQILLNEAESWLKHNF